MKNQIKHARESVGYRTLSGIMNFFGDMRISPWSTTVTAGHVKHLLTQGLPPGAILLTTTHWTFTRAFIPGELTHAAFYLGSEMIVEAGGHDVKLHSIYDTMKHADRVVVKVPRQSLGYNELNMMQERAISYIGMGYDHYFRFKKGDRRLCCTELIKQCYEGVVAMPLNEHGILIADDIDQNQDLVTFWDSDKITEKDIKVALLSNIEGVM